MRRTEGALSPSFSSACSSSPSATSLHSPRDSLKTSPGTSATRSCAGREGALSWFPIEVFSKGNKKSKNLPPSLSLVSEMLYPRDLENTMSRDTRAITEEEAWSPLGEGG